VLRRTIRYVLDIDQYPAGNSSNILLSGVKGVGKSYLMKGFAVVARELMNKIGRHNTISFIYCNYAEKSPAFPFPSTLIANVPDIEEAIDMVDSEGKFLYFLADEIEYLYKDGFDAGQQIVSQLLAIGKHSCCFGILSSSSPYTADFAFGRCELSRKQYVNLNYSVYKLIRVSPVRDRESLENIVKDWDVSNIDINDIFTQTGGVGRSIEEYFTQPSVAHDSEELLKLYENTYEVRLFFDCMQWVGSEAEHVDGFDIPSISMSELRSKAQNAVDVLLQHQLIFCRHGMCYPLVPAHCKILANMTTTNDAVHLALRTRQE
jgi:predicted AAA+ superfamily ATPase